MAEKIGHKTVLVYPKFYAETFWSMKRGFEKYLPRTEFGTPKVTLPPLGLMGLYNHLKKGHYYDKIILTDRNIDPRPLEELIKDADHVYMSGMTAQEEGFLKDASTVKKAGKTLIAGGMIVNEKSPLMNIVDHLVQNEAENVIDELLQELGNGNAKKFYKGTHVLPENFFIPDYSSINPNNYINAVIQASRGCPYNCEFCSVTPIFGRTPRLTPFSHIETVMRQLIELGIKKILMFADDNFISDPRKAIELLNNIYGLETELGYQFRKYTQVPMNLSDNTDTMREQRRLFRKTRFTSFFIGPETNNEESLEHADKHQNLDLKNKEEKRSLQERLDFITRETGASVMIGIIYGFDQDEEESSGSLIEFINLTSSPVVMAGLLTAVPGARLWKRLDLQNRILENSSANNSDGLMNFIPQNFSAQRAEEIYIDILNNIYTPEAFFGRTLKELEIIDPVTSKGNILSLKDDLYAAIRILTKEHARIYWKNLLKAHKVAKDRFKFMSKEYIYLISEYFAHCFQYTHFKDQVESLKEQQKERSYGQRQTVSFKDIQKKE